MLNTNSIELNLFKLYSKYVDFTIFKLLLELIKDNNLLYKELKLNLKELNIIREIENIEWFNKKWSLYTFKKEKIWEAKDAKINKEIEETYIIYRWFTSIGSRFYYLISLFSRLTIVWLNSIKK